MVFDLSIEPQRRWRRINSYVQLANIYAFFLYSNGRLARIKSRPGATDQPQAA